MGSAKSTCWTMIRAAATGSQHGREDFARRYSPVIRAYLASRWRGSPCMDDLDDAVQEVFVECLKQGGLIERADYGRAGGFRPFLYGLVRNIALRFEAERMRRREIQPPSGASLEEIEDAETRLSRLFDRAWAKALLREATELQVDRARSLGEEAVRRVELLRLRFQEGLPIREIAKQWGIDAAVLHHEYARARKEFKSALLDVVAFHRPGSPGEVTRECASLLALLT